MKSVRPLVLIVDDQSAVRSALAVLFEVHGIAAVAVGTPAEARARVKAGDVGVVVQDMNFSRGTTDGEEGAALFQELRRVDPELPVILMTAWASLTTAVKLVREGAIDYVQKPWDDVRLVSTVRELLDARVREAPRADIAEGADLCGVVYASASMHELVKLALRVAPTDAPVLVTGPSGAGKEKIAEIIHANSRRRAKPFVNVNVGALPDSLIEAELFGTEAGAFTGASKARAGRFEAAHGGTLFLDEIGNLSLAGQMRLLRVLQSGEYERLGSVATRRTDARIVSATNENLQRAIESRTFREDLYFRLNLLELRLPALHERPEDVLPLAAHFLSSAGRGDARFSEAARAALALHAWPGNVRELKNRVERALLVATGPVLGPADLDLGERASDAEPESSPKAPVDREALERALARVDGNVSRAAAELRVSRQALYRRMERLGVSVDRKSRGE